MIISKSQAKSVKAVFLLDESPHRCKNLSGGRGERERVGEREREKRGIISTRQTAINPIGADALDDASSEWG